MLVQPETTTRAATRLSAARLSATRFSATGPRGEVVPELVQTAHPEPRRIDVEGGGEASPPWVGARSAAGRIGTELLGTELFRTEFFRTELFGTVLFGTRGGAGWPFTR
jgi:hypothetical protein